MQFDLQTYIWPQDVARFNEHWTMLLLRRVLMTYIKYFLTKNGSSSKSVSDLNLRYSIITCTMMYLLFA